MKSITKIAFLNAVITAAYIALVASFFFYIGKHASGQPDTVIIPIAMLMLLVLSAAFTGFMIFGRPVLWYLDGRKKEALSLFFTTLGIFFGITLIAFAFLLSSALSPTGIACTEEAKLCPDGSAVGRTGSHCEFAPCP